VAGSIPGSRPSTGPRSGSWMHDATWVRGVHWFLTRPGVDAIERAALSHLGRTQQGREPEVGRPVLPSGRKGRRHGRLVHRRRARQCGAL